MSHTLSIDPGNRESGWVIIDSETRKPIYKNKVDNESLLLALRKIRDCDVAIIEMVADIAPIQGRMKTGRNGAGNTTSALTHSLDLSKEGLAVNATRPTNFIIPEAIAADEEWRPICGYETRYLVSNHGRVLSLPNAKNKTARLISLYPSQFGYPCANLWRDNKMKRREVHVLVLEALVGPRPPRHEVRHLDGDASRSILSNLAWGTKSENGHDRVRHGTHPQSKKTHCPKGHPYDAANTYMRPSGGRVCRICRRAQQRAWLDRQAQR